MGHIATCSTLHAQTFVHFGAICTVLQDDSVQAETRSRHIEVTSPEQSRMRHGECPVF